MSTEVMLKNVRCAFIQSIWPGKAEDYQDNKKFRHSGTLLVEPGSANDKAVLAAILEAAAKKYEKKANQIENWRTNPQKFCYTPGELKEYDGFQGMMALSAHRYVEQGAPGVFDSKGVNGVPNKLSIEDGRPYAGCYVNAKVEIWAQDGKNPGIRCTLISLQFSKDGDAFSAGTRPSDTDFTPIEEGADAPDDLG